MIYSKKQSFSRKVFSLEDIRRLSKVIEKSYSNGDYKKEYIVNFSNDVSLQGNEISIFDSDYFKHKKIETINVQYDSIHFQNSISINIDSNHDFGKCEIIVKSTDEAWYNSKLGEFSDIISDINKQSILCYFGQIFPVLSIPLILGTVSWIIIYDFLWCIFDITSINVIYQNIIIAFLFFICLSTWYMLFINIRAGYPIIEFSFGSKYDQKIRKGKIITVWLFSNIIIPLSLKLIKLIIK